MWTVENNDIMMAEGDFGIELPLKITGFTLATGDSVAIVIKKAPNGEVILTKTFDTVTQNTVKLELTEAESALLPPGKYFYRLDAYQEGNYKNNLIKSAILTVGDVA